MTTGATGQLGLALPVQGELSGTWGDTVNNGITQYTNIAIAGTLTLTNDGAVTLANTTGDATATNITSSLTGAGTVTAQFAIIKVTGTLTGVKTITGPSYSKTYVVDNTTATYAVTFKASGQTGVSIVAGEKATVYYNGTDYVKTATSTAGSGTVTAVSVASANGFTGTSSGGATPALTLATSITGVLKGNGTAISAATAGADYVAPGTATTFTATQTFNGTSSTFGTSLLDSNETVNVVGSAPSATTNYYVQSGSVQYYTSNAANNFVVNLAFSSGTTMNTALATGQSTTATLVTTQGSTAYYATSIQVDGTTSGVTTRWIGGAPTAGNASGLDVYRFAVIKTASATYTVLASLTQYKA